MSKKNKIQKRVTRTTSVKTPGTKPPKAPERIIKSPGNSDQLIVFDKKTKIFLLLLIAGYFIMSLLKIHTSSIGFWDEYIGPAQSESVIAGTPRGIRMDEWMVSATAIIGQYNSGMPLHNPSLGDGNAALIWGFPVKDISMILRPSLWAYFIFDVEHAFAFSWNFNLFIFIISTFLLFMLLTESNFWVSVFGAFFIFLSGAEQWWSYSFGSIMIYLNGISISFIYLLYSKKIRTLSLAGLIFILSCFSFLNGLYPPWQIPLIYLYTAILVGYLIKKKNFNIIREKFWLRSGVIAAAGIIFLLVIYHYYELVKQTYELLANTAYPGKRTTNGGDLVQGKLFSEFFGMYMTEGHVPEKWLNICETSSFMMFFPIIFYGMAYNFFKLKKIDWIQILLSFYIIVMLIWLLVGFPSFLSKISLLSMSPVYRTLPVFGLANCILLICYLGNKETDKKTNFSWLEFSILAVAIYIFVRVVANHINKVTADFFTSDQVMAMTALVTAAYLLIRYKYFKYTPAILMLLLLGMNISNFGVNPITSGLSSVLGNPLAKASQAVHEKDPMAGWAVFGEGRWANLLKANGIRVFNGVKFTPMIKDMQATFDSSGKNKSVYNRYAHVELKTFIDNKDSAVLQMPYFDGYTIYTDPCSPRFKKIGIKYFVFSYKPQQGEIRCMTRVDSSFYIFKRNDE
jgi:hypothetical protein